MLDPAKKILQQRKIKDRLGNGVLTAGFDFVFETPDSLIEIGHARVRPYADHKIRACANRVSANIEATVQVVYDVHQPDWVDVEDRCGVGIIAHFWRVAGGGDQIVYVVRWCDLQLGLYTEHVALSVVVLA